MFERFFRLLGYVKERHLKASLQEIENLKAKNSQIEFQKNLIARLLSDTNESLQNEHLQAFCKLLYKDFIDFAKDYSEISIEGIMPKFQVVEKELKAAISRTDIYSKNVIAVVGSFNSGKSAFISSFFKDKGISLPLKDEPSTAITTFVLADEKAELIGVSSDGGGVNLSELDPKIHSKIAHDFIDSLGFNLKKLMPFMLLKVPLLGGYEHLCFIDTPGYNSTKDDEKNAKEFLGDANALIWLIDIASAATLTSSDISFLTPDLSDKKLFVVLNKADMLDNLKENESIESITNAIIKQLNDRKIDFVGISVCYTDKNKNRINVYSCPKKPTLDEFLESFLGAKKEKTSLQKGLNSRLDDVYEIYEKAIKTRLETRQTKPQNLKSSKLDGVKKTLDTLTNESLSRLDEIISNMKSTIDKIFSKKENSKHKMPITNAKEKSQTEFSNTKSKKGKNSIKNSKNFH